MSSFQESASPRHRPFEKENGHPLIQCFSTFSHFGKLFLAFSASCRERYSPSWVPAGWELVEKYLAFHAVEANVELFC
jgi:hypothetical protein